MARTEQRGQRRQAGSRGREENQPKREDVRAAKDDAQPSDRRTGKVEWFSEAKGYGFIEQEGGPNVFVHFSQIQGVGFKTLNKGDRVEFTQVMEPNKGPKALGVVRLNA